MTSATAALSPGQRLYEAYNAADGSPRMRGDPVTFEALKREHQAFWRRAEALFLERIGGEAA